jgi:nucleoid-associated protein YgaU
VSGLGRAALALFALGLVAASGSSPDVATKEYVVRAGESLWSIAARRDVYADPYLWPVIYKFNRDQIKDPGHIYPSQRLLIPVEVDADTRRAARREAGAQATARGPQGGAP